MNYQDELDDLKIEILLGRRNGAGDGVTYKKRLPF